MLKLCGFPASNYYNKVKFALLEKGVPFEEVVVWPDTSEAFLAKTPLGKIPYIETDEGVVSESEPICEYIETVYREVPLLPSEPMARAKARELIQFVELYLEWEARRLYSEAFFGGKVSDDIKQIVAKRLNQALAALPRLTPLTHFALGERFSLVDCALAVHLPTVGLATKLIYGHDIMSTALISDYLARLAARPALQKVLADRKASVEELVRRRTSS